jgi:hypothetical protein
VIFLALTLALERRPEFIVVTLDFHVFGKH